MVMLPDLCHELFQQVLLWTDSDSDMFSACAACGRYPIDTQFLARRAVRCGRQVDTMRLAVRLGATPAVRALVRAGAPVDDAVPCAYLGCGTHAHGTLVHLAASHGSVDVLRLLVGEVGLDSNTPLKWSPGDAQTGTPLHMAVLQGQAACVEYLAKLTSDSDLNATVYRHPPHPTYVTLLSDMRLSLLQLAAMIGRPEVVRALLSAGADVHARDGTSDMTALHAAARSGCTEAVRLLLGAGADVDAGSGSGTPLVLAMSSPMSFHWVDGTLGQQSISAHTSYAEVARVLIEHGASIEARAAFGGTPLLNAAWSGHAEACTVLLRAGADVHAMSTEGSNALHLAVRSMSPFRGAVVKVLLDNGADPLARDRAHCMALAYVDRLYDLDMYNMLSAAQRRALRRVC
jgi:ankyrin repeat protein